MRIVQVFVIWIAIQLVLSGMLVAEMEYKISVGTYECGPAHPEKVNQDLWLIIGMLVPLSAFIPENADERRYCEDVRYKKFLESMLKGEPKDTK